MIPSSTTALDFDCVREPVEGAGGAAGDGLAVVLAGHHEEGVELVEDAYNNWERKVRAGTTKGWWLAAKQSAFTKSASSRTWNANGAFS